MKKILIIPNQKDDINDYLKENIDGLILSIEHLSINSNCYFQLDEIKEIIKKTNKEIVISLNKTMTNSDLPQLEKTLIELNGLKISKVLFYDLAVLNICRRLQLKLNLVVYQEHLNTNTFTNLFYQKRGVSCSLISNDITKEEINEIGKEQHLMMICYGYLPIFYSRRYLITNYLDYLKKEKKDTTYIIKEKNTSNVIKEEEFGTTVYSEQPINLINEIEDLNVDYIILNATNIEEKEFKKVLNQFINHEKDNNEYYTGFLNKKTVYKVEDYE